MQQMIRGAGRVGSSKGIDNLEEGDMSGGDGAGSVAGAVV